MQQLEKWQKHPFRVGIITGFVALPLLWIIQESLLRLATRSDVLAPSRIFVLVMLGAIPGAILGAGLFQALAQQRRGNRRAVKWTLLCHSGVVALSTVSFIVFYAWAGFVPPQQFLFGRPLPLWAALFCGPMVTRNFPFHCAVLMFCIGLFMRSRR